MEDNPGQAWLLQAALWSGGLTIGIPLLWAMFASIPGNTGLAIGWLGVLPVILLVPIGVVVTLAVLIAGALAGQKQSNEAKS
jgi:hypothetical protein